MGRDITSTEFTTADFAAFSARLRRETEQLERWFAQGALSEAAPVGGLELEAWLADADWRPVPRNEELLARLQDALVTTELSRFNVELNAEPERLRADALGRMERGLAATWDRCCDGAAALHANLLAIGILPTAAEADFGLATMTPAARYAALNEQVLRQREGDPLHIHIEGVENLRADHDDLMLESATTSFQIHMQVPASRAADYFNVAILLSGPMVAASANSPYLFGHDLWAETRVPLFEQAVETGGVGAAAHGPPRRVGFGSGYARESVAECFRENLEHFPVLLPVVHEHAGEEMTHLQLHNGTIWRWNRPLIGVDADGERHVRIEHRVVPGGPTVTDAIANAAFFFGLAHYYASDARWPPSQLLSFPQARDNFYACARHGLAARVAWSDGASHSVVALLDERLLPGARLGLRDLGLDPHEIEHYLTIVGERIRTGQNGAAWQRAWVARHGRDMRALTAAYGERQASGKPIHQWSLA